MDHNSSVDSFLRAIALVCVFIEEEQAHNMIGDGNVNIYGT